MHLPWLLVAGSLLLVVLIVYVVFGAYVPTKQRVALLEAELKQVYHREAELQTKLLQEEQASALREKALATERDELVRRADDLQRQLAAIRRR
jgi:predicted Holliday junction resolvase-like endonuclease